MYAEDIQQLVLGLLAQTEFANAASQAFDAVETIQEDLDGLLQQKDQRGLLSIKVGTTLLLAILGKVQMGKLPQSFRKEDWVDIADSVAAYALRMDGKDYSAFVFTLYADYIDACTAALAGRISPPRARQSLRFPKSFAQGRMTLTRDSSTSQHTLSAACGPHLKPLSNCSLHCLPAPLVPRNTNALLPRLLNSPLNMRALGYTRRSRRCSTNCLSIRLSLTRSWRQRPKPFEQSLRFNLGSSSLWLITRSLRISASGSWAL